MNHFLFIHRHTWLNPFWKMCMFICHYKSYWFVPLTNYFSKNQRKGNSHVISLSAYIMAAKSCYMRRTLYNVWQFNCWNESLKSNFTSLVTVGFSQHPNNSLVNRCNEARGIFGIRLSEYLWVKCWLIAGYQECQQFLILSRYFSILEITKFTGSSSYYEGGYPFFVVDPKASADPKASCIRALSW